MSLSLVAVFIPLLFMGGLVGRIFREFAVTLAVAVAVSLVISLTSTPMLCAVFLRTPRGSDSSGRVFARVQAGYDRSLGWRCDTPAWR
jgi:multidrug efflux pump